MSAVALLTAAADAFVRNLATKTSTELFEGLKGSSARGAYKRALAAAIRNYAVGLRLGIAGPLMDSKGILSDADVAGEIAEIVSLRREPDVDLIGRRWQEASADFSGRYNFSDEARLFLNYLAEELQKSNVFRPLLESRSMAAIDRNAEDSAESLAGIEGQMDALIDLMKGQFGQLLAQFAKTSYSLGSEIRYYDRLIEEKSEGFVGRQWIFDSIRQFTESNKRGYFFIVGEPGIGKSALAAQLVKTGGHSHHFNVRAEGISSASAFLRSICAQLIAAYELPYTALPPQADRDAGWFNRILQEVSARLTPNTRCTVVIDALDEAATGDSPGENLLYLPLTLPERVYIIATTRDNESSKPRIDCENDELRIDAESAANISDISDYLRSTTARTGIRQYLAGRGIAPEDFVKQMTSKSEGNFMYLRYVLPEIERGAYTDLEVGLIPSGLNSYYEDHWRRMRDGDREAWFQYKLPIILALTIVREPVTLDQIAEYSGITERVRIRSVLAEWKAFLEQPVTSTSSDAGQRRYRIYHSSFLEFLSKKEDVQST